MDFGLGFAISYGLEKKEMNICIHDVLLLLLSWALILLIISLFAILFNVY